MSSWSNIKQTPPKVPSLLDVVAKHEGKVSDKWESFLIEYESLFSRFQSAPITMLEIGIQNGGSLEIWAKYFSNAKAIVGSDINEKCASLKFSDPAISVAVGDANSDEAFRRITSKATTYDIIIDDGSHKSSDITRTFAKYFPILNSGGIFIIEDLHCSYWSQFEGGLGDPTSSMELFKALTDFLNVEHWQSQSQDDLLEGFKSKYDVSIGDNILSSLHSVKFLNSLCVIEKSKPKLGPRRVVGTEAIVDSGPLSLVKPELNQ
ncbi:class I SAM-dependent methyltransferase [Hyphomicrobium sp. MC1]|uniref:class I SAM-dependent methyltransferase n=1 Tax=Hyphomicrobium sp. (strain MC1) TaxID=717785 RepID=UPI000213D5C4|nr:class I SAM-dependent methyltransferase [Hyphomicrobium sp. MC1]CCB65044.1 protein of unknown function [Hyphomicrobium sp. MC1]